jgi:hypothetical protein
MIIKARDEGLIWLENDKNEYFKGLISSGEPISHKVSSMISLPLV